MQVEDGASSAVLDLGAVLRFFVRQRLPILGLGLIGGLLGILAFLLLPRSFMATANLVVVKPPVTSELTTGQLTVRGYQNLLESDAVVADTRERLVAAGVLEPGERLQIDKDMRTRVFVSRKEDTQVLSPILEAEAEWRSSEAAASIANTWVESLLEHARELVESSTELSVTFVEEQLPKARADADAAEDRLAEAIEQFRKARSEAANRWDRELIRTEAKSQKLLEEYQNESQTLIESRLQSTFEQMSPNEGGASADRLRLKQLLTQLAGTRARLSQIRPVVSLAKAISDDALWDSIIAQRAATDLEALEKLTLITEEMNPVFTELTLTAMRLELEISESATALGFNAQPAVLALERLQRERAAGLAELQDQHDLALTVLRRAESEELEKIEFEWGIQQRRLAREIEDLVLLVRKLSRDYNQATLAEGSVVANIRLAGAAQPPQVADSPSPLLAVLGFMVGCMLGLLVGLIREASPTRSAA